MEYSLKLWLSSLENFLAISLLESRDADSSVLPVKYTWKTTRDNLRVQSYIPLSVGVAPLCRPGAVANVP